MKHLRPILLSRSELERAVKIMSEQPLTDYICFYDYEIGHGPETRQPAPEVAADIKAMLDGTHPMFDREYLKQKLEQIRLECTAYGIECENRPMHEVLVELNAKRKTNPVPTGKPKGQ